MKELSKKAKEVLLWSIAGCFCWAVPLINVPTGWSKVQAVFVAHGIIGGMALILALCSLYKGSKK